MEAQHVTGITTLPAYTHLVDSSSPGPDPGVTEPNTKPEAPLQPSEAERELEPAVFAAPAIKALLNPAKDRRTHLLSILANINAQEAKLSAELQIVLVRQDTLIAELNQIEKYLAVCNDLSKLSGTLQNIVNMQPATKTSKSSKADPVSGVKKPKEKEPIETRFVIEHLLSIFQENPHTQFTIPALLEKVPADKRAHAKFAIPMLQHKLMKDGVIVRVEKAVYQLKQEPVLKHEPKAEVIVAKPPAAKPTPNPTSLGAALRKSNVTSIVSEQTAKAIRVRETSMESAFSKVGVKRKVTNEVAIQ